jgi:ribonuclease HI
MELTAAVRGLSALKESCDVEIITDSQYVKEGITQWIARWKRNGWKNTGKQLVKNKDLWEQLDAQVSRHKTRWVWTKGHASHEDNNRADELASRAARGQS